jgi:hypothetical protein
VECKGKAFIYCFQTKDSKLEDFDSVIKIDILFSFPHHYNEVQKDQQLYQFDAEKNKKCFTISYSVTKILNKILKYVILVYNFAASQEQ